MAREAKVGQWKILLLQGPNMTYLGRRQPELYGTTTAAELDRLMLDHAAKSGCELQIFYTHVEGEGIARIYQGVDEGIDGLLINPAAWLYAGYPLRDTLRAMTFPIVEVHMTNIERRGLKSITAEAAHGTIAGFGIHSYVLGLDALLRVLADRAANR